MHVNVKGFVWRAGQAVYSLISGAASA